MAYHRTRDNLAVTRERSDRLSAAESSDGSKNRGDLHDGNVILEENNGFMK